MSDSRSARPGAITLLLLGALASCSDEPRPPDGAAEGTTVPKQASGSARAPRTDQVDRAAVDAAVARARELLRAGQARAAHEALTAFDGTPAAEHVDLVVRAQAAFEVRRYEEAVAAYRKLVERSPDDPSALFNLGLSLVQSSQLVLGGVMQQEDVLDEAVRCFDKAAQLDPKQPLHRYGRGVARETLNEIELAIEDFDAALALAPDHVRSLERKGRCLLRLGRLEEAAAALERARRADPHDAPSAYRLGTARQKQGRLEEAARHLGEATRLQPSMRQAHFNLARVLGRLGRAEEAEAARLEFERLRDSGLDEESVQLALVTAGDSHRDDARVLYFEGLDHERSGRAARALESYERAAALSPEVVELHVRIGSLRLAAGDARGAERALREALKRGGEDAVLLMYLAGSLERQGKLEEAARHLQRATELEPDSFHARKNLGVVLQRLGRHAEAEAEIRRAEVIRAGNTR